MKDRVRPPRELEALLDELKAKGVFQTKQKGMMFAAAFGYALDSTKSGGEPVAGVGEGIRLEYFQKPRDDGYIDALAVAHHGMLDVLSEEQQPERVEVFERYAHAGLKELRRRLDADKRSELDVVCEILDDFGGLGSTSGDGGKLKRLKGLV